MKPVLEVKALTHTYSAGTPFEHKAIEDVNLEVMPGEFLGIIGHTGSGKSTLIQHLNGLLRPTGGEIRLDGEDIWAKPKEIRRVRFQVGLVFQYPEYQPFDLSGGQKRRVAIAGVIAMEPKVLILDEPTAGLDPRGREAILAQLRDYHRQKGNTVILVSHSMEEIARNVDRIIVMSHAHKLMDGTPEEIFSRANELLQVGLDVPQVTKVAMELQRRGLLPDSSIYTIDELVRRLLALKGGEAVC